MAKRLFSALLTVLRKRPIIIGDGLGTAVKLSERHPLLVVCGFKSLTSSDVGRYLGSDDFVA